MAASPGRERDAAEIRVNGRRCELEDGLTIAALLGRLDITAQYALVERNGEPVAREDFFSTRVEAGDEIVVARPVAGG